MPSCTTWTLCSQPLGEGLNPMAPKRIILYSSEQMYRICYILPHEFFYTLVLSTLCRQKLNYLKALLNFSLSHLLHCTEQFSRTAFTGYAPILLLILVVTVFLENIWTYPTSDLGHYNYLSSNIVPTSAKIFPTFALPCERSKCMQSPADGPHFYCLFVIQIYLFNVCFIFHHINLPLQHLICVLYVQHRLLAHSTTFLRNPKNVDSFSNPSLTKATYDIFSTIRLLFDMWRTRSRNCVASTQSSCINF